MPQHENQDPSDQDRLEDFVTFVRNLLQGLILRDIGPDHEVRFDEDLHPVMMDAWDEVQPHFDRLIEATREADYETLNEHGLTGSQLNLKLAVFSRWWNRFREVGGLANLRWLFEAIDNLLESLIEALGVSGAVAEFKDALMGSVDV